MSASRKPTLNEETFNEEEGREMMNTAGVKTRVDPRSSVFVRGDLNFAGATERVDHESPDQIIAEAEEREVHPEILKAEEAVLTAQTAKEAAREYFRRFPGPNGRERINRADAALKLANLNLQRLLKKPEGAKLTMREALEDGAGDIEARLASWEVFVRYILQDGASKIDQGFRNFLAIVRRTRPDLIDGLSLRQVSILLGQKPATVSAREIKLVDEFLEKCGFAGHSALSAKSPETRKKLSKALKGNRNRQTGTEKKKASAAKQALSKSQTRVVELVKSNGAVNKRDIHPSTSRSLIQRGLLKTNDREELVLAS